MNCFIDDNDEVYTTVKLSSAIKADKYGYFIEATLTRDNVLELLKHGIAALYSQKGYFYITVQLTNNTDIRINGLQVTSLSDSRLQKLPLDKITLKELILKRYSTKTKHTPRQCYATKILLTLKV